MSNPMRRYEIDAGPEARRLAYVVDDGLQSREMDLAPGDLIALGQLHALIHLADRVDALARVVRGDGR
jgi:hypothetical protein